MNTRQIQKLVELFESGHRVMISSHYVDTFVQAIYQDETEDNKTEWVYDSEVYSGRALNEVAVSKVSVYKQITDWDQESND